MAEIIPLPGNRIAQGGGGPHDPSMEARVAVLEQIAKETKEALVGLRSDLVGLAGEIRELRTDLTDQIGGLRTDVSHVRGRLESLPTTWVMLTAIIGGQITLAALLFAALKLGAAH